MAGKLRSVGEALIKIPAWAVSGIAKKINVFKESAEKQPAFDAESALIRQIHLVYSVCQNRTYEGYENELQGLSYGLEDIQELVKRTEVIDDRKYGLFLSALINNTIQQGDTLTLDLKYPLDYVGHRLKQGGRLVLKGVQGNYTGSEACGGLIELLSEAGDYVGQGMSQGMIIARKKVGNYAGAGMKGGILEIMAAAGNYAGKEMEDGTINIYAAAGEDVAHCMRGGKIIAHKMPGNYAGRGMKGGTLDLLDGAGDYTGYEMHDGTIIVYKKTGQQTGANRHGGLIKLLAGYKSIGPAAKMSTAHILNS